MKLLRITSGVVGAALLTASVALFSFGTSVYGDINGDGSADNADITRLMRHLAGYNVEIDLKTADLDGDGSVSNSDITRLMRCLAGLYIPPVDTEPDDTDPVGTEPSESDTEPGEDTDTSAAEPEITTEPEETWGPKPVPQTPEEEVELLDQYYDRLCSVIADKLPGIVCWGDSLTQGPTTGEKSYPTMFQEIFDAAIYDRYDPFASLSDEARQIVEGSGKSYAMPYIPIVNMGAGSDTTNTILGRSGAVPFVTTQKFTIPAESGERGRVLLPIASANGRSVNPRTWTNAGIEVVTINGVEGEIIQGWIAAENRIVYYFQRFEDGVKTDVPRGTTIYTSGSEPYRDHVAVIYMGQNGGFTDLDDFVEQIWQMVDHQTRNSDRYIIVGLHVPGNGQTWSMQQQNARMKKEFGDHFINLYDYMTTMQAMNDAGLTPSAEDAERIRNGLTPKALLSDGYLHFNTTGYNLLAKLVFGRMSDLGYFDEVNEAIADVMK